MASVGIVLELQRDCLDKDMSVSTILRKAKVIAAKLDLADLKQWITSELEGYACAVVDLPEHRKGIGQPKFHNPYNGWCPIMTDDGWYGTMLRTLYLPQPISELEELALGGKGSLVMYYNPTIQEALQQEMPTRMECALHFSKSQIITALDYVRDKTLDWTLELEGKGVIGEGFSFKEADKKEAQVVTNHIYGGNIGVLGNVAGDAKSSRFVTNNGSADVPELVKFLDQVEPASAGLDPNTRSSVIPLLEDLRSEASGKAEPNRIAALLGSLRSVLEGASGNLVASAMLMALTGHAS